MVEVVSCMLCTFHNEFIKGMPQINYCYKLPQPRKLNILPKHRRILNSYYFQLSSSTKLPLTNTETSRVQQPALVILTLGRLKQEDCKFEDEPGLHSELKSSLGYWTSQEETLSHKTKMENCRFYIMGGDTYIFLNSSSIVKMAWPNIKRLANECNDRIFTKVKHLHYVCIMFYSSLLSFLLKHYSA